MAKSVTPDQTASDIDYAVQTLDIQPSHLMGLVSTKPVFKVSDKASFKPVSSATETSWKIEISHIASLHMILSKKRITKALIRMRRLFCACVVGQPLKTGFLALKPLSYQFYSEV